MLLAGSRHSHRDSRPAGRGTTGKEKQPQQTIKTAMAAGLGSSLFIFRGLSSISPHILQEASRPSSSSSTSSSTSRQSSAMGSCHSSPEDGARKGHRRAGSSESSQALLMPRPASHSQQQQQTSHNRNDQQKHSWTYSRSPKPEYRLRLECADCRRRNVGCSITPDLNCNGNTLAYASPLSHRSSSAVAGKQQLKEWTLTVDFCGWSRTRETALKVLGKHMRIDSSDVGEKSGSGREGNSGKPFRVEDLLRELGSEGVKYESCMPQDGQGGGAPVRGWERL